MIAPEHEEFTGFVFELSNQYYSVLRPRAAMSPPLNGNDLINEFNLKPSALFQCILKHVEEERLARKALTREQAIKLVAKLLKQQKR